MPTYLVHGFRWTRAAVRIHIILNNLDDAAAEWIIAPTTSITFLNSFYTLFDFLPPSNLPPPSAYELSAPHEQVLIEHERKDDGTGLGKGLKIVKRMSSAALLRGNGRSWSGERSNDTGGDLKQRPKTSAASGTTSSSAADNSRSLTTNHSGVAFNDWSIVKLLEQYDPEDLESVSQPFAYVADQIIKVDLSVSVTEEMAAYDLKRKEESAALSPDNSTTNSSEEEVSKSSMGPLAHGRLAKRLNWIEKLRDGLEKDAQIGWFIVVCGDEERLAPEFDSEDDMSITREVEEPTDPQRTPTRKGLRRFFSRANLRP